MNTAGVFSVWFSKPQGPVGESGAGRLPGDTWMYQNEVHTATSRKLGSWGAKESSLGVEGTRRCPSLAVFGGRAGALCRLDVMQAALHPVSVPPLGLCSFTSPMYFPLWWPL